MAGGRRSLYEVLRVQRSASREEVKAAYLRCVKSAHPDKGGSAEAFQEVAHAFKVLGDPAKRQQYDASGEEADPSALEDEEDAAFRDHVAQQMQWEARHAAWEASQREQDEQASSSRGGYRWGHSKEEMFAESGFRFRFRDTSHMFNVDEWERGHRLGRYGTGSEADMSFGGYYAKVAAQEQAARERMQASKMSKEQAYFFRRNQRERKRLQDSMRKEAERGRRKLHTASRQLLRAGARLLVHG